MKDKQIIIDGVDVSGCRYLFDDTSYKRSKTSCSITLKDCKYLDNNCYFKQLKRKEQECEELKSRLNCRCFDPKSNNNRCISYNRIAKDYERDLKQLDQFKQTLAEIKKIAEQISLPMGTGKSSNRVILANQILQKKIKEVI